MNVERMLALADILENKLELTFRDEPVEFKMDVWDEKTQCGTACCIGGLAEIIWGSGPVVDEFSLAGAATLLGLSRDQSIKLFYGESSFYGYPLRYVTQETAAAGIRRMVAEYWNDTSVR